jgi:hypothetical protein
MILSSGKLNSHLCRKFLSSTQRNSNLLIGFQQNWVRALFFFFQVVFIRVSYYRFYILSDIPVILPPEDELVFTDRHLGQGLQASETELPNNESTGKQEVFWIILLFFFLLESYLLFSFFLGFIKFKVSSLPQFNEVAMAQLEVMGFPAIRCQKALLATGNQDPEAAMEWLFGHMEDPGTFPCAILLQ